MDQAKHEFLWAQRYRPTKIKDIILPERYKKTLAEFLESGELPMLLFSGSPGCGKTTAAKALCEEMGMDYMMINGSMENNIDTLRTKIHQFASTVSFEGGAKCVIIDEADSLNNHFQTAFRAFVEEFSSNCRFILTCNYPKKLIEPLHSRFIHVQFDIQKEEKPELLSQMFKRVCQILDNEGIEYEKPVVAKLVGKHYPDNRTILNELQRYSVGGKIDSGILANSVEESIGELVEHLKAKDFTKMREWVGKAATSDTGVVSRQLYDMASDKVESQSIPQLVILLNDYSYKAAFVADQEVNTAAMLTEIMANVSFK